MYINIYIYILNNNYNKKRAKQKQTNKITELQKANIEVKEIKSVIFKKFSKAYNNDKNNKPQLQRKKEKEKNPEPTTEKSKYKNSNKCFP